MAIWQFDLALVPRGFDASSAVDEGQELPLLPEPSVVLAHAALSSQLGSPWAICEGVLVFGAEDGNRVDLAIDAQGCAELSIRIDARSDAPEFLAVLCDLATITEAEFFSSDLREIVQATPPALRSALMRSFAWQYALDPASAVRRRLDGRER